jgi:hypothetical protein
MEISPARSGYHVEYWFVYPLALTTGGRGRGGGAPAVSDYTLPLPLGSNPLLLGIENGNEGESEGGLE